MKGACCVAKRLLGVFLSALLVLPVVPLSAFAETAESASADLGGVSNAGDSDEGATDGAAVGGGSTDEGSLVGAPSDEVDAAQDVGASSELQDVAFSDAAQVRDASVSDDDPFALGTTPLVPQLDYSGAPTTSTGSIACGQPVTFALSATGGSGSYQYMFTSVSLDIDGERSIVHNMTSSGFSDANTFVYTFVASGTYYLYCGVRDTVTSGFKTLTERIAVSDPAYPRVEDLAQRVVDECNAKGYKTEYEKALFYNNFIVDNVEYDYSYKESSALGAFAKGKAVCEGYYQALKMLLVRSRIQCVRTPANGHVWATVRLDGVWTQVDPTKDDDATAPFRNIYFGITDEMSELVHDGYRRNPAYPCGSTAANYLLRSGEVAKYVSKAETEIRQKLTQGSESFTVALDCYAPFKEVYHAFYPMVVAELQKKTWGSGDWRIEYVKCVSSNPYDLNDSHLLVRKIGLYAVPSSDECTVTISASGDHFDGASSAEFAVWSLAGGQDDLVWYQASRTPSGWEAVVPVSRHATAGAYAVHAYATLGGARRLVDDSGSFAVSAPAASVRVATADGASGALALEVRLSGCPSGATEVLVPLWFHEGGQDDLVWHRAEPADASGSAWRVSTSADAHRYQSGAFSAHVYVRCANGVYGLACEYAGELALSESLAIVLSGDESAATISASGGRYALASAVQFPVWSLAGGQDDLVWYQASRTPSGWEAVVPVSRHATAGAYAVHAYATLGGARRLVDDSGSFVVRSRISVLVDADPCHRASSSIIH